MNQNGNGQSGSSGGSDAPGSERRHRHTPADDPNLGTVFDDRYRIEERIGVGGMGIVYRAVQVGLERTVVVKILSKDRLDDEASVQRFQREARTLSRLDHPNIVTVHDFGYQNDLNYIVMEHVDGYQLDQLVQSEGGLEYDTFVSVAAQLLDAVGQAHREGMVHRDLKPSNIMLTERPETPYFVKVLDFGLAKLVSGEDEVTKHDALVGSMPYLSPEQIQGEEIDQRVDVYALGIVFYFALTARKPFRGTNASILYDQVHSDPPPLHLHVDRPEDFPRELFELVNRCLSKDAAGRPPDAAAVLDELEAITGDELGRPMRSSGSFQKAPSKQPDSPSRPAPHNDPSTDDTVEASSSELLGQTPDTSDRFNIDSRSDVTAEPMPEADSDPTQDIPASQIIGVDGGGEGRSKATIATVAALAIVVGGAAIWFMRAPAPETDAEADPAGQEAPAEPSPAEEKLERIDELIDQQEVDGAEKLLESVITMENADSYEEEISEAQRRIHIAQLYLKADRNESDDNYEKAIEQFEEVLKLAPGYRDAEERLDRLERYATIRIATVEGAEVRVDGKVVGASPLETWVEPGTRKIEIEADGHEIWSKPLDMGEGENLSLEPELEKSPSGAPDPAPPPEPTSADETSDDSAEESSGGSSDESSGDSSGSSSDELLGFGDPEEESGASGDSEGGGSGDDGSEGDDFELFPGQ